MYTKENGAEISDEIRENEAPPNAGSQIDQPRERCSGQRRMHSPAPAAKAVCSTYIQSPTSAYTKGMQFRPDGEFTPGAPYPTHPAQPPQSRNLQFTDNPIQGGQWLTVEQNQHSVMSHAGMSHPGMSQGNMSHAAMSQMQGGMTYGSMPHGNIHHGSIQHVGSVNQAAIPLWPHQQPGVASTGRQFSPRERAAYYATTPYTNAHQQTSHPSAGHPPPGSYIPRMSHYAHGFEASFTPVRNHLSMGQVQMVNRGGSYLFQHSQALYNTGESIDPRAQKQHQRPKHSVPRVQESQVANLNGNVPVSPAAITSTKKKHPKTQRHAEHSSGLPLKAPVAYGAGSNGMGTSGHNSYSEAHRLAKSMEYEGEQEQKRERIKAQVEQKYALLEADTYDVKMERWMDGEDDEFCPF